MMQNNRVLIPPKNTLYAEIDETSMINSAEGLESETGHGDIAVNVSSLVNDEIVGKFPITVLEDVFTRKSRIVGKRILCVRYFQIEISKRYIGKAKYCFRYRWIKKCGTTNDAFFFETGPECPLGKGIICCKSTKNKEIYDLVHTRCLQLGRLLRPISLEKFDRRPLPLLPLTPAMKLPENHIHTDYMIPERKSKFPQLKSPSFADTSGIRFDRDHLQNDKRDLPVHDCEQETDKRADPTYIRNTLIDKMYRPLPPLPATEINGDLDDIQTYEECQCLPVPSRSRGTSPAEQSPNQCSETSEIQKSYDINETNNTGEGTNHNQDAAYDRELYRNDSDTAIRDTHCPEDEVYNDDVSCIEDPNENNLSKRFVFHSDLSEDDSSEDETEAKSVSKNFIESTRFRSRSMPFIKEWEHIQSESIRKQAQGCKVVEMTVKMNEVLPYMSNLGMTSDSTLTTYDACSINSIGSVTSEIQTTYGTNKTDLTGEGTDRNDNAEIDREIHRNGNDYAIKDKHNSQDEAYNDGVSYIEDPNQKYDCTCDEDRKKKEGNASMKKNSDVDSSDNDSSNDETEVKSLVDNFSESTSSRATPLTKEQELSQSKTIWKQVQSYRREIERTIRVNEVLPYLSNLEDKDAILALQKSSPREAVCLMLEQIIASHGAGKWTEFVNAVHFAGYSYVANILEGKSTEGIEQDRHDQEKLLQIFTPNIVGNLLPHMLVDPLYAKEVIGQTDKEEIECEEKSKGPTAASQMLVDRIPRKIEKWYPEFVVALRENGHGFLADEIDIIKSPCSSEKEQQKNAIDKLTEEDMNETKEDNDETDVKGEYRRYITPDYKSTSIQEWDLEQERSGQPLSALTSQHAPPVPPRIKKNHVRNIASQLSSTNDESNSLLQELIKENRRLSKALRFSRKEGYLNVRLQIQETRNGQEVNGNDTVIAVANSETNTSMKETPESTGSQENVSTTLTVANPVPGVEPPREVTTNTPTANGTRSFASDIQNGSGLSEQCSQQEVPYPPPPPYNCVVPRSVPHENSERTCFPTNQLLQHPSFACNSNLIQPQLHRPFFNTFPDQVPVNHVVPPYLFNSVRPVDVTPRPHLTLQQTAAPRAVANLIAPPATFVNQPILVQPALNAQMLRGNTLEGGCFSAGYVPAGQTNLLPIHSVQQTPVAHMFGNNRSDSGFGSGGLHFYPLNYY